MNEIANRYQQTSGQAKIVVSCWVCGGLGEERIDHTNCPEPYQDWEKCMECSGTGMIGFGLGEYFKVLIFGFFISKILLVKNRFSPIERFEVDEVEMPF